MIDKNPYEKDDVNVPNFGETEDKGADPIFNMDTTSINPETDTYSIEQEAESSSKTAIIVLIVFLVLFLAGTVSGWLLYVGRAGEINKVREEYDAYVTKSKKEITDLQTQVSTLKTELEQAKATASTSTTGGTSTDGTGTKVEANTYYLMDEGVGVRPSAGEKGSYADYSKLPTDIQNIVYQNGKTITTRNAKFPIYETKQVGSENWGRIADNAWVCIDYGKKQ